jgi:hypothetical protein
MKYFFIFHKEINSLSVIIIVVIMLLLPISYLYNAPVFLYDLLFSYIIKDI